MNEEKNTPVVSEHPKKSHNSISLKTALLLAILISILFLTISYLMYIRSPKYKYDLARPDVKKTKGIEKDEVIKEDIEPVDSETVQRVKESINSQVEDLRAVGDFSAKPLSDKALQLSDK